MASVGVNMAFGGSQDEVSILLAGSAGIAFCISTDSI